MSLNLVNEINSILPECCRVGFASIDQYNGIEKEHILKLLPSTKSAIVITHHVQNSLEWTWFKFNAARTGETNPADIHCLSTTKQITNILIHGNFKSFIIPYPGIIGPMFKTIALKTGIGKLGDNFLFMNKDWGPWIHLRVILTDAEINTSIDNNEDPCTHCNKCIEVCPVGAIEKNSFDGIKCQNNMREYSIKNCDGSTVYECELCLRACPVGKQPKEITVKYKE